MITNLNEVIELATKKMRECTRKGSRAVVALESYIEEVAENIKGTSLSVTDLETARKAMLNGADDWFQYSHGGCSLCYNYDIAELNFTPKMAERALGHNNREPSYLLDVQARRLRKAAACIASAISLVGKFA